MYFFIFFKAVSQDILEYVGQEAALERMKKDAKSNCFECWDKFINYGKIG
jgi:hypothetical protein